MKATSYAHSDPGNKRTQNEDFYLMEEDLNLYVVCDGVGGHIAGGVASETAARTIRQIIHEGVPLLKKYQADRSLKNRAVVAGLLQRALQGANDKIFSMSEVDVLKKGMCTTAVCLLLLDDFAIIAHAGDSRIYLSRAGQVHQLTEDHKFSTEMVKKGILTPEEAARSPQANVLTRAVGYQPTLQVETLQVELMSGDTFMLCSDGLYNYADKGTLRGYFQQDVQKLPEELVKFAKDAGGADNITVVAVKLDEAREAQSDVVDVLKKTEILGKIPIFRYMTYPEINKLLSIAVVRNYAKGTEMVKEGDPSDEMFIIAQGVADVLKGGVKVAQRRKGEVFGEMGIFDHAPRSASVRSEDAVSALVMNRTELLKLLRQDSQVAVKFLWALNGELNARIRVATENAVQKSAASVMPGPEALPFDFEEEEPTRDLSALVRPSK